MDLLAVIIEAVVQLALEYSAEILYRCIEPPVESLTTFGRQNGEDR